MKTEEFTKLINEIKKEEEEIYGITLNLKTPTRVRFYLDNFSNKDFHIHSIKDMFRHYKTAGMTKTKKGITEIFVFDRSGLIDLIYDKLLGASATEADITNAAYHEIRHCIQQERIDIYNTFERFCLQYLPVDEKKYNNYSDYYMSTYEEIDAYIYGFSKTSEKYKDDPEIYEYYKTKKLKFAARKMTYNFDTFLEEYIKKINPGKDDFSNVNYPKYKAVNTFWNKDGTFKTVKEILIDRNAYTNSELQNRIVTSAPFLLRIDLSDLTNEEKIQLNNHIDKFVALRTDQLMSIQYIYENGYLSEKEYLNHYSYLNKQISTREEYKNYIKVNKSVR